MIKFVDYYDSLSSSERESLLDALARCGAMTFFSPQQIGLEYQELRTKNPAYVQFSAGMQSPAFRLGFRYEGARITRMMQSDPETMAPLAKNRSALAWQPRDDPPEALVLDPDLSHLHPAKAPLLRKLIDNAFNGLFATRKKKLAGRETGYMGAIGTTKLTVWVDFDSRAAQLRYAVSIPDQRGESRFPGFPMRTSGSRTWVGIT